MMTESNQYHFEQDVLSSENEIDVLDYGEKCDAILEDEKIIFAGLLNGEGVLLTGGYKQRTELLTDEKHNSICKSLAARVATRKEFDPEFGHTKYSASRRENAVIMSFPINSHVVMVIAESGINIDKFAFRILDKLGRQWGSNSNE